MKKTIKAGLIVVSAVGGYIAPLAYADSVTLTELGEKVSQIESFEQLQAQDLRASQEVLAKEPKVLEGIEASLMLLERLIQKHAELRPAIDESNHVKMLTIDRKRLSLDQELLSISRDGLTSDKTLLDAMAGQLTSLTTMRVLLSKQVQQGNLSAARETFSQTGVIAKNLIEGHESFTQMRASTDKLYEGIDKLTKSLSSIYADHGAQNAPEFEQLRQ